MATDPHGSQIELGKQTNWGNQENSNQYDLNSARQKFHGFEKSNSSGLISNSGQISMADLQGIRYRYIGFYAGNRTANSATVTFNNVSFGNDYRKDRHVICVMKGDMGGTTTYATSGTIGGYSASCAAMGNKYYTSTTGLDATGFNGTDRQWRQCHIMYRKVNDAQSSGTVTMTTAHSDQYTNAVKMWVWVVYSKSLDIKGFGASGFTSMGWGSNESTSETSSKGYTNAYSHMASRSAGLVLAVFGSERAGNVSGTPQRDWALTNITTPSTTFQNNHRSISETSGSTSISSFGDEWTGAAGRHYYSQGATQTHHVAYNAQDRSRTSSTTCWACADFT